MGKNEDTATELWIAMNTWGEKFQNLNQKDCEKIVDFLEVYYED